MFKLIRVSLLMLAAATILSAQNKLLTVDDIFSPDAAKRVRFGGAPIPVRWSPDGRNFMQIVGGKVMRVDPATMQAEPYIDSDALAAALQRAGVRTPDAAALANSPNLQFNKGETAVLINHDNDLWLYEISGRSLKRLTSNRDAELEADFSPDGKQVSFVRNNNLFVVDAKGDEKQLTRDGKIGEKPIYNGYLDWIYEEELYGRGQKRGYWWSPDSKFIAFLRLDEAPVPRFTIVDETVTDQRIETTEYPQPGDPNPLVRVGIADVGKTSILPNAARIPKIGERLPPSLIRVGDAVKFVDTTAYRPDDLLIARVAWTPDSKNVVFQALNREQTYLDLNLADLNGRTTKFLQETTPASVEVYDNPTYLNDGTVLWQSARNGWRHIYVYGNDGKLLRPLTSGKWEVRNLYGVDQAGGWVYFSGTKDSHIAENIYRVRLTGGEPQRLTTGDGTHSASFNASFSQFIAGYSDVTTPPQVRLMQANGTLIRVLSENKVPVLGEYRLSKPEFLKVKTRDGFEMEAMMIKPPDFDPSKKYPVFQFTYAGPHAPSVVNRWGGNRGMWFQLLAQKGYIVWVCDNRTASGKGQESVWAGYKRLYELELRDIEDGLNYLKSTGYVDADRIGLHGWSYGGSMTSYALTHSKSFKIGIAGGTVTDWRLYDSIYAERYMMTPRDNIENYDKHSILKAAKDLHGRLLLIHGMMDDNVHMQNTTQFIYELQKAGKQFDLMLYPTQRHGITDPRQVHHWYGMMTEYVLRNL
jgi:dipeptidyl-peptidase-4